MFVKKKDLPPLPDYFNNEYLKDIRVVIDCTPIHIQKPGNLMKQSNTYSTYKSDNVYTVLIGTTPSGGMVYMSAPYEGCISDRKIVEDSDFCPFLDKGDGVLGKFFFQ